MSGQPALDPEVLVSAGREQWLKRRFTSRKARRGEVYLSEGPARHAPPKPAKPSMFVQRAIRNSTRRRRAKRQSLRDT